MFQNDRLVKNLPHGGGKLFYKELIFVPHSFRVIRQLPCARLFNIKPKVLCLDTPDETTPTFKYEVDSIFDNEYNIVAYRVGLIDRC